MINRTCHLPRLFYLPLYLMVMALIHAGCWSHNRFVSMLYVSCRCLCVPVFQHHKHFAHVVILHVRMSISIIISAGVCLEGIRRGVA